MADQVFAGGFGESFCNDLGFDSARDDHHTVEIAENQIAGLNGDLADLDRTTVVENLGADGGILRIPAAAEDGPILFQHAWSVAVVSMNHGTYSPAGAGGGGENLAPIGAAHIAAAGQKDVSGFELVERFRKLAKRLFLRPVHIDHQCRHGASHELHLGQQRLDRLWKELVGESHPVKDVPDHWGVEPGFHEFEKFGFR